MVSAQQYSYSEILEMHPYERDAMYAMIQEDAARAAKAARGTNSQEF